jgi:hypothetical protein
VVSGETSVSSTLANDAHLHLEVKPLEFAISSSGRIVKADAPKSHIHTAPVKVQMRVRTAEAFSRTLDLQYGRTEFDEGFERFPFTVPAWPDHHKPTL